MIIIGIDPGKRGAIATINTTTRMVDVEPMPIIRAREQGKRDQYDLDDIAAAFRVWSRNPDTHVVLERALAFPMKFRKKRAPTDPTPAEEGTSGVVANWNRGYSLGIFEGILRALGVPYQPVLPQVWQRAMLEGIPHGDTTKAKSVWLAQRLFPSVSLVPPRHHKPHDGFADALCLAEYGRRLLAGDQGRQRGLLDQAEVRP